jgi:FtsP/CotA-like multicopper oxidase with cupredoxin domain
LAACTSGGGDAATGGPSNGGEFGVQYEKTGTGPMVEPTIPTTPDVPSYFGEVSCDGGQQADAEKPLPEGCQRTFDLTARPVIQKIANFPLQTAVVWGYASPVGPAGSPGPTLISYEGEQVQIKVTNELPDPTTIHVHGLHQPNESDGVAGISQPEPIKAEATFAYPAFVPGHVGSFAYHSHFQTAVQDMRGLVGMWDVLPREQHESVKPTSMST